MKLLSDMNLSLKRDNSGPAKSYIEYSPKLEGKKMVKVTEIQEAIEKLPEKEFSKLRKWIAEKDWNKWDKEIQRDSDAGKLDFLLKEATDEKEKGKLKDL